MTPAFVFLTPDPSGAVVAPGQAVAAATARLAMTPTRWAR